jgi:DNA mismatch endonuclease (patch repair protein)
MDVRQARIGDHYWMPEPASWASSDAIRRTMRGNRGRDTLPELALRQAVHRLGLRYLVSRRPVPTVRRTGDLVFPRLKVVVFLDGCFWHGCSEHYVAPVQNAKFWRSKVEENRSRDAETDNLLRAAGWHVLRVWEHEPTGRAAERVRFDVLKRASLASQRKRSNSAGSNATSRSIGIP